MSFFPILPVSFICILSEFDWPDIRRVANLTGDLAFGGTHLPDLTIVTPVFDAQGKEIIFWAASRGHHADVSAVDLP